MLLITSEVDSPAEFISCGNLINENGFMHIKRKLDCYVLIFVQKGCLYIRQNEENYEVRENEFILLLPNTQHYGYKASPGYLSYYWAHFNFPHPHWNIEHSFLDQQPFSSSLNAPLSPYHEIKARDEVYFLPVYGKLPSICRSTLLFAQLLDTYKRGKYASIVHCYYALNTFLLEFSEEMLSEYTKKNTSADRIENIIEWIRRHYRENLNVAQMAERFNYNPDYLSALFKKHTGYPLLLYINLMRLNISKDMLVNTNLSIKIISEECGFKDEKYYFRIFKKYIGTTPNKYRQSFRLKYVNIT